MQNIVIIFSLLIFSIGIVNATSISSIKEIDNIIKSQQKKISSTEKINFPTYKGKKINFSEVKNIKNLFTYQHITIYEKELKQKETAEKLKNQNKSVFKKHKKTALEKYPLASYKLQGFIKQNNKKWAILITSGLTFYVTVGDYIGFNNGVIRKIDKDNNVIVEEIVKNTSGALQSKIYKIR